jgi:hypothetical protein
MSEFEPYFRLVEAVMKNCFLQLTEEGNKSVMEFAERRPNKLIEAYCDASGIDENKLRVALKREAERNLKHE